MGGTVSPYNVEVGQRGDEIVGEEMTCELCDMEEEEHGVILPSTPTAPYVPTRQERLEHEVTHVPYRSWCEHCVKGKAKSTPHKHEANRVEGIPVIGLD